MTQFSQERAHEIVVGVDGSESSKSALAWAVKQARRTGATVVAINVWDYPVNYGYPAPLMPGIDFGHVAREVLALAIADAAAPGDRSLITAVTAQGNPARILLDAAAGADLLVVGSRGHGGFTEALLGSVAQRCVHRATCPVVVVRGSTGSD